MRITRTYHREYTIEETADNGPASASHTTDATFVSFVTGPTCISPVGCDTVCCYWRDGHGWTNRYWADATLADLHAGHLAMPACETLDSDERDDLAAERAAAMNGEDAE